MLPTSQNSSKNGDFIHLFRPIVEKIDFYSRSKRKIGHSRATRWQLFWNNIREHTLSLNGIRCEMVSQNPIESPVSTFLCSVALYFKKYSAPNGFQNKLRGSVVTKKPYFEEGNNGKQLDIHWERIWVKIVSSYGWGQVRITHEFKKWYFAMTRDSTLRIFKQDILTIGSSIFIFQSWILD